MGDVVKMVPAAMAEHFNLNSFVVYQSFISKLSFSLPLLATIILYRLHHLFLFHNCGHLRQQSVAFVKVFIPIELLYAV